MLEKKLKLGGLQVGGPRTIQNSARFRVADNVYQTGEEVYIPRFPNSNQATLSESKLAHVARYENKPFFLALNVAGDFEFYNSAYTKRIKTAGAIPSYCSPLYELAPNGVQFEEKLGCLFMNFPQWGLFKYDGFQVYRAGVPLPSISSAQYSASGACYTRIIQHTIDQQGNTAHSGYVEFRATPNGANNILVRHDKGTVDIIANGATTPASRYESPVSENLGYMSHFFAYVSHTFSAVNNECVVTTGGAHKVQVGAYIIVGIDLQSAAITTLSQDIRGVAHKVKAFDATTVTLDLLDSRILDNDGTWVTTNYPNTLAASTQWQGVKGGSNYWLSVWTSDISTGVYYFRDLFPAFYEASAAQTKTVFIGAAPYNAPGTGLASAFRAEQSGFNLNGIMGEFYDVTSVKKVFPFAQVSLVPRSFTTYQDLALVAYENEIYHSDTSLGGAFEMTSGLAFILVGEGNDGEVQSVCGNADFLLVSRQFNNYYVSGNLPTANYRRQKISSVQLGCYSNESSIAVGDKIIFATRMGIYALYSGGKCEEISEQIKGFFSDYSETFRFPEENYFAIYDHPEFAPYGEASPTDQWLRIRLDINRKLLCFVIQGNDNSGQMLVLNMNSGEFYTWSGLLAGIQAPADFKDICFIGGTYWTTRNGSSVGVGKELKLPSYGYASSHPPILEGTWFTAGEPSLEKKLNQVKFFGLIKGDVAITHKLDWKTNATVSDETYTNSDEILFSHKKRLTPANFQAVSVKFALSTGIERFELEGIEVEWQPLQESMKR